MHIITPYGLISNSFESVSLFDGCINKLFVNYNNNNHHHD